MIFVLWICGGASCWAASDGGRIVVFSSLCVHPESGDIIGDRVILMEFPEGSYVLYQSGNGVVESYSGNAIVISENFLKFSVIIDDEDYIFTGKMRKNSLSGNFIKKKDENYSRDTGVLPIVSGGMRKYELCK